MILSILIPTLPERNDSYVNLIDEICGQCFELELPDNIVEIITDSRPKPITTGEKRNYCLGRATGDYIWFVDDDDSLFPNAINEILKASETGCDVMGICGIMTIGGIHHADWEIRIGHPYEETFRNGTRTYLRFPNHITPMRREHALKAKFPDITYFEDYEYASKIKDLGVLKTQTIIHPPIYHYKK